MKRLITYLAIAVLALAACTDNDSFTTSKDSLLTMGADTVSFDTIFSTVPTSTGTFWVYNRNDDGIRLSRVALENGNQRGFRVNVDGAYLDNTAGSVVNNLEIRGNDSIRVFVELTTPANGGDTPVLVEDNLVFTLQSGTTQKVNLRAYSWDAELIDTLAVIADTTISSSKPLVISRGITVAENATLTIEAPAKLYFHDGAGINVYGKLLVYGDSDNDVVMRGDRTDRMFSYLPYDRVSGQWGGIHIMETSKGNVVSHADIHSGTYGIVCDSAALDTVNARLTVDCSVIHNVKGAGIAADNSYVVISNSQISNTLGNCVEINGGKADIVYSTLAQFYPFSGDRGVALSFSNIVGGNPSPLYLLNVVNTIVTGYSSDEFMGNRYEADDTAAFNYKFTNTLIRTPEITDEDYLADFTGVIFEQDDVEGKSNFANIDENNLYYDFRLDSASVAVGAAMPLEAYPHDRLGRQRGDTPDIGCYQFAEQ